MYVAPCAARSRASKKCARRRRCGTSSWKIILHWLEAERQSGCTESSLAKYLSHVRGLLDYAWRSGRRERNVLDGFNLQHKRRREEPRSLSLEEAERLVRATEAPGPSARRDRLIVLLLYGCGLRTHELCALDVAHVNRERRELLVLTPRVIGRARFPFQRRSTRNCLPICWSAENAARCSGRTLVNGDCA